MLEALEQAEHRVAGIKQCEKAVLKNMTETVYIAQDADERATWNLQRLCEEHEVKVNNQCTMQEIGRACGIQVKAAAAAILKA